MLCCLIGGLLTATLLRAAKRRRAHNPALALAFGWGVGALVVELVITALVPLGSVDAPGSLAGRLALLVVPAVVAIAAGLGGAAASLLFRQGVMTVAAAAVGGALVAEELDLHLYELHTHIGVVAAVVIHAPVVLFLAGGLLARPRLPEAVPTDDPACRCDPEKSEQGV